MFSKNLFIIFITIISSSMQSMNIVDLINQTDIAPRTALTHIENYFTSDECFALDRDRIQAHTERIRLNAEKRKLLFENISRQNIMAQKNTTQNSSVPYKKTFHVNEFEKSLCIPLRGYPVLTVIDSKKSKFLPKNVHNRALDQTKITKKKFEKKKSIEHLMTDIRKTAQKLTISVEKLNTEVRNLLIQKKVSATQSK